MFPLVLAGCGANIALHVHRHEADNQTMQRDAGRVLVIDDDAVVVVAVSDLLEEHGYRVFALGSPIGATQVIVREQVDIAVIDVDLPEMQGDSVVRLFRTWDRLKDLPVIMLSGAESAKLEQLQRELPGIQFVKKADMYRDLVQAVDQVLSAARSERTPRSHERPRGADPSVQPKPAREIHQAYFDDLAEAVPLLRSVWSELLRRNMTRSAQALRSLDALHRRSQLLDLETVAELLHALKAVFTAQEPGVRAPPRASRGVEDAITALSKLQTSRTRDFAAPPTFLIRELREIADELRALGTQSR